MKTEHEIPMQILYDRIKADAAAKKQYLIDREARTHNSYITAVRTEEPNE